MWLTVFSMVSEFWFHSNIPFLQFVFCMSIDDHVIPVFFIFFIAIHATLMFVFFYVDWVKDSVPCASSEMIMH